MAFPEIDHETRPGQSHGLRCHPKDLLNTVSEDCYVIWIYQYWEFLFTWIALKHIFHHELEIGRSLGEPHWHLDPPELALIGDKGRII